MKTLAEVKNDAILLQERINSLNHKLENPRISLTARESLESSICEVKAAWYDAMCDVHAHNDFTGNFKFQKENNPYRG